MIYKGNKSITGVYWKNKAISAIYRGATLVWQSIRSCFGAGYWDNDKPWDNDEGWQN